MISTPIAFVLGAGASFDFGFPIGTKLLEEIIGFSGHNMEMLRSHSDFEATQIDAFTTALKRSGSYSVDAFLEKRPEFMDLGKTMMAVALIAKENSNALFDPSSFNWMRYLFARMATNSFEEFGDNQVSFITFNYDRSLEHFFSEAVANTWGKSVAEAGAVLSKIPIVHLHGQMGFLPWQAETGVREYNGTVDRDALSVCVNEMKIVHEGIDERRQQFEEAKARLHDAVRVYFLGVGFGKTNMERLDVLNLAEGKASATAVGLTDAEHRTTQELYGTHLNLPITPIAKR
jgi:hypothetical protein